MCEVIILPLIINYEYYIYTPPKGKAVKRANPSGFKLTLAGFGLNGPSQKSPGLNGSGNYELNPIGLRAKRAPSQTSQITNFLQNF